MYYFAGFALCPSKIDIQVVRAARDTERVAQFDWAKHVFNAAMDDVTTVQKAKHEGLTNITLESCHYNKTHIHQHICTNGTRISVV